MKRGRGRPKGVKNKERRVSYFNKYMDEAMWRDAFEQKGDTLRRMPMRISKGHLRLLRARARREGEDYEEAIAQDYASNPEAMEMIRQYLAKYPPERLGDLTPIYPKDSVMEEGGVLKEPARIFLRALAIASKREG